MRATTVRFGADLWEMLESEAEREGVSSAQFVRDATLLRLGALAGVRGDSPAVNAVNALAELVRRHDDGLDARPPGPVHDPARLAAVRATGLFDRPAEPVFARLAELGRRMVGGAIAAITLIDDRCQLFVSGAGLPEPGPGERELPLELSFCRHVIEGGGFTVAIPDARVDPRLSGNPLVARLSAVAYLGVPLVARSGQTLGTLCVLDRDRRDWTPDEIALLEGLAPSIVTEIEVRSPALLP